MLNFINDSLKYTEKGNIYTTLKDFDDHTIKIEIAHNGS